MYVQRIPVIVLAHRTTSLLFLDVPAPTPTSLCCHTLLPHCATSLVSLTVVTHCDVLMYRDSCTMLYTCISASDHALTHRIMCPCMLRYCAHTPIHPSVDLQLVVLQNANAARVKNARMMDTQFFKVTGHIHIAI